MRLLFLDIDGVLRVGAKTEPHCVEELNRITFITGAGIVVTSTWRHDNEIYGTLRQWGVYGELIGKTPDLSQSKNGLIIGVERWKEIEKFLDSYPHKDNDIAILDDDKDMGKYMDCLIQTDPYKGLTSSDANRAINKLLGKKSYTHYFTKKQY